jgi:hypothetical protein
LIQHGCSGALQDTDDREVRAIVMELAEEVELQDKLEHGGVTEFNTLF